MKKHMMILTAVFLMTGIISIQAGVGTQRIVIEHIMDPFYTWLRKDKMTELKESRRRVVERYLENAENAQKAWKGYIAEAALKGEEKPSESEEAQRLYQEALDATHKLAEYYTKCSKEDYWPQ